MSAAAHWVRAGEEAPMERAALGKLIASCPGHDLTTLDKPGEPGEAGEEAAPVVVAAGEWQIEMPTDSSSSRRCWTRCRRTRCAQCCRSTAAWRLAGCGRR